MSEQNTAKKISFVIPCYRSQGTIETVVNEIRETETTRFYTSDIFLPDLINKSRGMLFKTP